MRLSDRYTVAGEQPGNPHGRVDRNRRSGFHIVTTLIVSLFTLIIVPFAASSTFPRTWISTAGNSAIFLQWTELRGTLAGQFQMTWIEWKDACSQKWNVWTTVWSVEHINGTFQGIRSGSSVTLLVGGQNWTGVIDRGRFRLNVLLESGGIMTFVLRPGTVDEYNRAVSAIRARVDRANEKLFAAAAVKARERELYDVLDRIDKGVSTIRKATFEGYLKRYSAILQEMADVYGRIRSTAAGGTLTCRDLGDIQFMLGTIEHQYGALEFLNNSFAGARKELLGLASEVTNLLGQAHNILGGLQQATLASGSTDTGRVTAFRRTVVAAAQVVNTELKAARARLLEAEKQVRDYNQRAKALWSDAQSFVDSLECQR